MFVVLSLYISYVYKNWLSNCKPEICYLKTQSQFLQGVELGPLEITINSLSKSIESTQQDIAQLQLIWLREQGELVRLSKENDTSRDDVNLLKKKISILSQKKIRIESMYGTVSND